MRRTFRWLRRFVVAVGVLALLAIVIAAGALWRTLPPTNDAARIPGLGASVSVGFDADGIPRIQAKSWTDAAAALGYVHARDRMFQMELMRRAASGRLSELAGPATLPLDKQMRLFGLRRRALADVAALQPETRALLDAYATGVNAWITARGRFSAAETLVTGTPEPWTAVDSLLWGKTLGLWLSSNWRQELTRQSLAGKLPPERLAQLWPAVPPARPADAMRATDGAAALLDALPGFPAPFTLPDHASNAWAVDAAHSDSGAPLLAGDPHLSYSMPGIWYLVRIDTPDGVLAGATAPGAPFLVLGHNGHVAWTFTTAVADTEDVFVETPTADGGYETPDGPRPFTVHEERIAVRGAPDVVFLARETRHGPVVSDLSDSPVDRLMAVQMASLAPGDASADGLLTLDRAASVADAVAAAPRILAPVQNLIVADHDHIALATTGRVPVRKAGDGAAPVPGADGTHDWTGWASGDALPHSQDPATGRLVNANEPIASPGAFMSHDGFGDWRARRIRERLGGQPMHSQAEFAAIQTDTVSVYARDVLPKLLDVPADGQAARARDLLRGWNADITRDAPQPLILNAWLARFEADVLARAGLPPRLSINHAEFVAWLLATQDDPAQGGWWCGGSCAPMLGKSLSDSIAALAVSYGPDPASWHWGVAHQTIFAHPILGRLPVIGALTTSAIESPGDFTTIDRGGMAQGSFDSVHGASFRAVHDLADLSRSLFVVVPGQSGNPISAHARDFIRRWRDGATVRLGPLDGPATASIRLDP